ncbi:hypothetical protein [Peterkaempfera griseoplana]|uniref:hypothetical protein n=1 Tax=Peterkaempfera griseoplana TaxID=66896 RepID=UPI0006E303E8|nr:hypothetical protein [Peterkaempfera griseoplana]
MSAWWCAAFDAVLGGLFIGGVVVVLAALCRAAAHADAEDSDPYDPPQHGLSDAEVDSAFDALIEAFTVLPDHPEGTDR